MQRLGRHPRAPIEARGTIDCSAGARLKSFLLSSCGASAFLVRCNAAYSCVDSGENLNNRSPGHLFFIRYLERFSRVPTLHAVQYPRRFARYEAAGCSRNTTLFPDAGRDLQFLVRKVLARLWLVDSCHGKSLTVQCLAI